MGLFTNSAPLWVSILFLLCFFVPIFMIVNVVKQGVNHPSCEGDNKVKRLPTLVLFFFATYYLYVTLMSFTGIFQVNTLPPRVLLFTAIPLVLFYFLFAFRTKTYLLLINSKLMNRLKIKKLKANVL